MIDSDNNNSVDKVYCVYRHITPDNRSYIGMTEGQPAARWLVGGKGYKSQRFYEAIKLYGWDKIKHYLYHPSGWIEVADSDKPINDVYWLTQGEAELIENMAIISLKTTDPMYGWNVRKGSSNLAGISDPPPYDDSKVRTKLTLSLNKGDVRRLKLYSLDNHISVSSLVMNMFNTLHADDGAEG